MLYNFKFNYVEIQNYAQLKKCLKDFCFKNNTADFFLII